MHPDSIDINGASIYIVSGIGQMLIVKRQPGGTNDVPFVENIYNLLRFVVDLAIADKPVNPAHVEIGNMFF